MELSNGCFLKQIRVISIRITLVLIAEVTDNIKGAVR